MDRLWFPRHKLATEVPAQQRALLHTRKFAAAAAPKEVHKLEIAFLFFKVEASVGC